MRMLLQVNLPHESFNAAVKDGSAGGKLKSILDAAKPEAVYFMEIDGERCCMLVVDVKNASAIPAFAEPWFLTFQADVKFRPVMTPEDLGHAGLEALGKKWG
ncbi:MAG: DUF3303 family protein [Phycisphaeraceae bacterium]